jgi:glutathione S-transferase
MFYGPRRFRLSRRGRRRQDARRLEDSGDTADMTKVTIIGSYASPYVRKVLACLALKGLDYEIDPITAFFGNDAFERLSPLRRIPVLIDGDVSLCDSSVICAYLDEAYPERPLLPESPKDRARARWLEEYADTRLGDVFIWGLFYQKFVHQLIWGTPGDEARAERTLAEDLPREMDYLERELPDEGFLFGDAIGLVELDAFPDQPVPRHRT